MKNTTALIAELRRIAESRQNELLKLQMLNIANDLQLYIEALEWRLSELNYISKLNEKCNKTQSTTTTGNVPQWLADYCSQQAGRRRTA